MADSTTHHIADDHKAILARAQHVLEWLAGERVRLHGELAHVLAQGERTQAQLDTLLRQHYGITGPYTLDSDAGTITTPDSPTRPEPAD